MTGRGGGHGAWVVAALLLAAALGAFFWSALSMRGMLFLGDIIFFYYPVFVYATEALRGGTIPLWCPELEGGMPFLGFWEGTFLYPVDLVFRLFRHAWVGFNASLLFHYLLAGLGMLLYGRGLGLSPLPALASALIYTLNGFMVTHLEHVNMVVAAAWMPWLFLAVDRFWEGRRAVSLALAGVVVALQLLGGHPDVFLMCAFAIGLYALLHPGHGLLFQRRMGPLLFPIVSLAAVYGLGIALAAGQVLSTLTLAASSWTRPQENLAAQHAASLTPGEYWLLLLPNLLGRAGDDTYFGPSGFWERCGYAGALTLALALAGLAGRHRMTVFWSVCIGLGLVLATGPRSDLFNLLRDVPPFGTTRLPSRWIFLFDFGIALLAGAGLQVLGRRPLSRPARQYLQWAGGVLAVFSLVAGLAIAWQLSERGDWLRNAYRGIVQQHSVHPFDAPAWMAAYTGRLSGDVVGLGVLVLLGNGMLWSRLRSAGLLPWLAPLGVVALYLDLFRFGADYNPVFPGAELESRTRTAELVRETSRAAAPERLARLTSHRFERIVMEHRGFWPDYGVGEERRKLLEMLPGNWNLLAGWPAFGQNDTALRVVHWRKLGTALYLHAPGSRRRRLAVESRLWPWHNVGFIVSWYPTALPGLVPLTAEPPFLYRVPGNEGRAFFRSRALSFDDDRALHQRLLRSPELLADHVLLSTAQGAAPERGRTGTAQAGDEGNLRAPSRPLRRDALSSSLGERGWRRRRAVAAARRAVPAGEVALIRAGRHDLELRVNAPHPGYIVLTDTFYPGWKARLNGRDVPILRANAVQRAVATPAGRHHLTFSFEPAAPRLGFFLSLIALAGVAAALTTAGVEALRCGRYRPAAAPAARWRFRSWTSL